jgi:hypothetical protein
MSWFDQADYEIKFDRGLEGAKRLAIDSDVVIVVDVLSFTTCVEAALSKGAVVYPYLFKDERAQQYAESMGAHHIYATSTRRSFSTFGSNSGSRSRSEATRLIKIS